MKGLFHRIFYLYAGEGTNALLFVSLAFIWAIGAYCGLTLFDGLFLEKIGAQNLPYAYLLTAFGLFFSASLFLFTLKGCNPFRLFNTVLIIGTTGYSLILLSYLSPSLHDYRGFWLAGKVFANIFFVLLTTCYWFFIDQYYNLQNAKRLYSLFNAAIFLGNAAGAAILSLFLNLLGIEGLIAIIICCLIITIFTLYTISSRVKCVHDEDSSQELQNERFNLKKLIPAIMSSKFTWILMTTYLVIQLLNITTEYSYMDGLQRHFSKESDGGQLTIFLGECMAWIAIMNMLFGLFCYSRVINRFGVNNIVMISPLFFLSTFIGWSFSDVLLFAVLGVVAVEGVSYLLDENNSNLLLNAVPTELKNRVRIAIDSFFEPLGMLISAIIFLCIDSNLIVLGLLLSLIALACMIMLRSQYRGAVLQILTKSALQFHMKTKDWILKLSKKDKRQAEFHLMSILRKRDETSQLMAYEALLHFDNPKILPRLLTHMNKMSYRGKLKAIDLLSKCLFALDPKVLDHLGRLMLETAHPSLRSSIHFYFARNGLLHPSKVASDLKSYDLILRGAAIIALKKNVSTEEASVKETLKLIPHTDWINHVHTAWLQLPTAKMSFYRIQAATQLQQLLYSKIEEEICMGLKILSLDHHSRHVEILLSLLNHPKRKVARLAAEGLEKCIDSNSVRHAQFILEQLTRSTDSTFRLHCIGALGKLKSSLIVRDLVASSAHFRPVEKRFLEQVISSMGLRTVPILLSLTKDCRLHDRCRVLAGKILGRVALPQLRANLFEIIVAEIERAYFYYFHANKKHEDWQFTPLIQEALLTGYHSVIDFIIQLLGAAGSIERSELLAHALRSKNPKMRGSAIESLEKTCESKIFRRLKPLIDDRPLEDKLWQYIKDGKQVYSFDELLEAMDNSPSSLDRVVALTIKAKLNHPDWRLSLQKQMEQGEELLHNVAFDLLEVT
ncbi:MAG: hypothetical protein JHC93_06315 [Parachlamydiales bacterium]|nr:hypothetical protein [Parachlamydiales bacterium]